MLDSLKTIAAWSLPGFDGGTAEFLNNDPQTGLVLIRDNQGTFRYMVPVDVYTDLVSYLEEK